MRLASMLGIPIEENYEPEEDGEELSGDLELHYSTMVRGTALFLRGGGGFSALDWCGFTALERQAAAVASQVAWRERGRHFARGFESEGPAWEPEADPVEESLGKLLDGLA